MPYAVILGNQKDATTQKRQILGLVSDATYTIDKRTFDLGSSTITGVCTEVLENPALYVLFENDGTYIHAGYVKKPEQKDNQVTFKGEDLRKQLDIDVLLDFSQELEPDLTISGIFRKVAEAIATENITNVDLVFQLPDDATSTKFIVDYTGQYVVANALKFLKVFLAYYEYYIDATYSIENDTIVFTFNKASSDVLNIRIDDFDHDRTQNDIKVNRVVATIAYQTSVPDDEEWEASDSAYYDAATNRGIMISDTLPDLTVSKFPNDYALRLVKGAYWEEITEYQFNTAKKYIQFRGLTIELPGEYGCPTVGPSLSELNAAHPVGKFSESALVVYAQHRILYTPTTGANCNVYSYFQLQKTGVEYYKKVGSVINPRPNLPKKIYTLGLDNNVYENNPPDEQLIIPAVTQYFESDTLADAQFNALYYLLSNRWIENVILKDTLAPISLRALTLFQKVNVYDKLGRNKILPVAEITLSNETLNTCQVKLGFKKTSFTEIIKNEIAETESITKQVGGGGSVVINNGAEIPTSVEAPAEPEPNKIWYSIIQ